LVRDTTVAPKHNCFCNKADTQKQNVLVILDLGKKIPPPKNVLVRNAYTQVENEDQYRPLEKEFIHSDDEDDQNKSKKVFPGLSNGSGGLIRKHTVKDLEKQELAWTHLVVYTDTDDVGTQVEKQSDCIASRDWMYSTKVRQQLRGHLKKNRIKVPEIVKNS